MYPGHFTVLLIIVAGLHIPGTLGLFSSTLSYSAVIPTSIPTQQPIIQLYIHQQPSPTTSQSVPSVNCDITHVSRDGVVIRPETSPLSMKAKDLYIYAKEPMEAVLSDGQVETSFFLSIRCSCSENTTLMTSAIINVTTTSRWQHLQCRSFDGNTVSTEDADAMCFAKDLKTFTTYENVIVNLGWVGPPLHSSACPGYDVVARSYLISPSDPSQNGNLLVKNDQLVLQSIIDRETTETIKATITCLLSHIPDQSVLTQVSRNIGVHVQDVDDCGPVIVTSTGSVKVARRTMAYGQSSRLIFHDNDSDPTVNQYSVRVLSDADHILEYSQATHISARLKLYRFTLRVTAIPDRDLNATVVIRDETLVSRKYGEDRIIFYVFVKGIKPATSIMPEEPLQTMVNVPTSFPDSHLPSSSKGVFVSRIQSSFSANRYSQDHDYTMDEPYDDSQQNLQNQNDEARVTRDETTDASMSDSVMSDTGHVSHVPGHVMGDNKQFNHMPEKGLSQPSELNANSPANEIYRINVSSAAAKYSRVLEVFLVKPTYNSFQIISSDENIPFEITEYNGIIYTTTSLIQFSNTTLTLYVKGKPNFNLRSDLRMQVDIQVLPPVVTPLERCDGSCSSAQDESTCINMCGYGAPGGRCVWRPAGGDHHYITCVPSTDYCPNRECDEDLENNIKELCPQDCARKLTIDGDMLVIKGLSSTTRARGVCYCQTNTECTCVPESLVFPDDHTNGTFGYVPEEMCNTRCVVMITIFLLGAVVMFILVLLFCRYRTGTSKGGMKHVSSMVSLSAIPSDYVDEHDRSSGFVSTVDWSPKLVDANFRADPKWEIPRSNIRLEKNIGEGEFGRVIRGQAFNLNKNKGATIVAVKMLKECASTTEFRDLLSEYHLLKDVSHRNVIKLLGVCSQKGPFYLVVEHCEHGSLRSYLRKSRHLGTYISCDARDNVIAGKECSSDIVITTKDCLSFAWQTANGMSYLCDMKLVHRDLAARNLLVSSGKIIKISDFGLTRDIYEEDTYMKRSKGRIPVKWMAPESLYDQIYTSKSDVWSFGVVLWEIITLGATPYPGVPPERLYQLLKTGYRMDKPQGCSTELFSIMQQCWCEEPTQRLPFKHIASQFEDMLKVNMDYLDLTYQPESYMFEDDATDGAYDSDLKTSNNQNEPEYGSINILSTDSNSYVLTPSLQLNGEPIFTRWPHDDRHSNWSHGGIHSPDDVTEETHFLQDSTEEERVGCEGSDFDDSCV